jgi:hypothetical protein
MRLLVFALFFTLFPASGISLAAEPPTITDPPSRTASPFTVGKGEGSLELQPVAYARSGDGEEKSEAYAFGQVNLRYGLSDSLEVQAAVSPSVKKIDKDASSRTELSGFGDTVLRLKWALVKDEVSGLAVSLLPTMKLPTAKQGIGNHYVEGGLALPVSLALPYRFSLGFDSEWIYERGSSGRHRSGYAGGAVLSRPVCGKLAAYGEFFSVVNGGGESGSAPTAGGGALYDLTSGIQLNAGANLGLGEQSDDLSSFIGISVGF